MSKISYVGISDLIKLTTKTIEEHERAGIRTALERCQAACAAHLTADDIASWCEQLAKFRALSDTVAAVRAHLRTAKDLQVFAGTLLQYVRAQSEYLSTTMRSVPRQDEAPPASASGAAVSRHTNEEERLAWDLIRQS